MTGIFSKTTDSNLVEAAGRAGLDFIILDQEHGPITNERLHDHVRAARAAGMKAIVRVRELNHNAIGSALDAGADGVQVPNVATAEQARTAIDAARFHPDGHRGVCRFVKAAHFGTMDRNAYFTSANTQLLILQVEGTEGISNLDEILAVSGFDILFIGPYDLSQSLGYPGQIDHPEVIRFIRDVAEKAKAAKIRLGTFTDTIENARAMKALEFEYLAYSVDLNIFSTACTTILNQLNS